MSAICGSLAQFKWSSLHDCLGSWIDCNIGYCIAIEHALVKHLSVIKIERRRRRSQIKLDFISYVCWSSGHAFSTSFLLFFFFHLINDVHVELNWRLHDAHSLMPLRTPRTTQFDNCAKANDYVCLRDQIKCLKMINAHSVGWQMRNCVDQNLRHWRRDRQTTYPTEL